MRAACIRCSTRSTTRSEHRSLSQRPTLTRSRPSSTTHCRSLPGRSCAARTSSPIGCGSSWRSLAQCITTLDTGTCSMSQRQVAIHPSLSLSGHWQLPVGPSLRPQPGLSRLPPRDLQLQLRLAGLARQAAWHLREQKATQATAAAIEQGRVFQAAVSLLPLSPSHSINVGINAMKESDRLLISIQQPQYAMRPASDAAG